MTVQLKYLQLKYDPRTKPFLEVVNRILKEGKDIPPSELTPTIISKLNERKLSLAIIRTTDDLQREFPLSKVCYKADGDRWFVTAKNEILPIEDLLETTPEDLEEDIVKEYTELVNLRIETALDETRFDRALMRLESYAQLRNDAKRFFSDTRMIQNLLFSITRAIQTLAEIGNRDLIDAFLESYLRIRFDEERLQDQDGKELLTESEQTFFEEQLKKARRNREIHDLCSAYEKSGGFIEKTAVKIKAIRGVNLAKIMSALLNLRTNYLINDIRTSLSGETFDLDDFPALESKFEELEKLIQDERVAATQQIIHNLAPLYMNILEFVFRDESHSTKERERAFNRALNFVVQKGAYANLQLINLQDLTIEAIQEMDQEKLESHLDFYKHIMERNFKIFKKSMAQIKRETDEIRRLFQERLMGLK